MVDVPPQNRRILFISDIEGFVAERLTVVRWSEILRISNIRDFDDIVLDLGGGNSMRTACEDFCPHIWEPFGKIFEEEIVAEFLEQDSRLVIIGDPQFWIISEDYRGVMSSKPNRQFLSFLKMQVSWREEVSDRIEKGDDFGRSQLATYLERLNRSKFVLDNFSFSSTNIGEMLTLSIVIADTFLTTRTGKPIAFSLRKQMDTNGAIDKSRGRVVFLPDIEGDRKPSLRSLFNDYFRMELSESEPIWVSDIRVSDEDGLDVEVRNILAHISELEVSRKTLELTRLEKRRILRLLYGTGQPFEETVLDALTELGGVTEKPKESNKEDGWVMFEADGRVLQGVLEMKGVETDTFNSKGVRQLGEWVQRGKNRRNIDYKPIFIGASKIKAPIQERPHPFVTDIEETAKEFGVALLRAEDLFRAVMAHRQGILNIPFFWITLFSTVGYFNFEAFLTDQFE